MTTIVADNKSATISPPAVSALDLLGEIERKVLWLSSWLIHHANHIRPNRDDLKVGGHQASCASAATILTALYMHVLRPEDRIAVKPHASPVLHSINYLLGRQSLENLQKFRALGGAQAYPSRTKDIGGIDFSTGSVGLGVGATLFASLVQDYLDCHDLLGENRRLGRMIALMGDAELDEGNVFEALLEGWKHDVRNLWWIVDYNRQSLDGVVNDDLFNKITQFFETVGWRVINLKYGKRLQAAFEGPCGGALKSWIDNCPNQLYSALTFKGGKSWRTHLRSDLRGTVGFSEFLDSHDDDGLHALMTNLGGHDMEYLIDAFDGVEDDTPRCFIAYTIKGHGLPIAGHKDNHAGLMTPEQMDVFRQFNDVAEGQEWDPFAGLKVEKSTIQSFLDNVPYRAKPTQSTRSPLVYRPTIDAPSDVKNSTQAAFGGILNSLSRGDDAFASKIVTTSPDVAVSTNLGSWINQRAIFHRQARADIFKNESVLSPLKWTMGPSGQHIELGIAEHNLFLLLGELGLSEELFGQRLLPVGTVYDPFVNRGLDALIYACYQGARFMIAGTPSGITLAAEGGAHQSINTPLLGMSIPHLTSFEPAFADELAVVMGWGFTHMQRHDGGAVYLRLSTRPLDQPKRQLDEYHVNQIISGAYWLDRPEHDAKVIIAYTGAVAAEAIAAHKNIPGAGLMAITSSDRLYKDWREKGPSSYIGGMLAGLPDRDCLIVTVLDGHPATLSWLGGVCGHRVQPLGVSDFGQSADVNDLYAAHGIDEAAIIRAAGGLSKRR